MQVLAQIIYAEGFNPFGDGLRPSFGPFNDLLRSKVGMVLALVWALGFVYCAFQMVVGWATLARGRRQGYSDAVEDGKGTLLWSGGAVLGLASLPLLYAILIR